MITDQPCSTNWDKVPNYSTSVVQDRNGVKSGPTELGIWTYRTGDLISVLHWFSDIFPISTIQIRSQLMRFWHEKWVGKVNSKEAAVMVTETEIVPCGSRIQDGWMVTVRWRWLLKERKEVPVKKMRKENISGLYSPNLFS